MNIEKIGEDYLQRCVEICQGGYSKLSLSKGKIKEELIEKYCLNGNREKVSELVAICEKTVFDFLDPLMSRGRRSLGWPEYHEEELKEKLNIALQTA